MKKGFLEKKILEVKANSAHVIIGKNGLTEDIVNTIKKKLNKNKIIKVKMLKTVPELERMGRKEFAAVVAKKLNADLMEIRGFTLIIQKRQI